MLNKKIIVVILAVIIFFSSAALFYFWKSRDLVNQRAISQPAALNGEKTGPAGNLLEELKLNHPEFSPAQLKFYAETAAGGNIAPCEGRTDAETCVAAVAFIKKADNICGEINEAGARLKCADAVLLKTADAEISQCDLYNNDIKTDCLINIFQLYQRPEDCANFKILTVRQKCQGVVYYQKAFSRRDQKICADIADEYLKSYCLKNIR